MPPQKNRPKSRTASAKEADRHAALLEEERVRQEAEQLIKDTARLKTLRLDRKSRRAAEISELVNVINSNTAKRIADEAAQRELEEWDDYLACHTVPRASDIPGVNTFFSLLEDDAVPWDFDVSEALKKVEEASLLATSIDSLAENHDENSRFKNRIASRELAAESRGEVMKRLDKVTARILQYADKHADGDGADVNIVRKLGSLKFYMWANRSKDPNAHEVSFKTKEEMEKDAADALAAAEAAEEEKNSKKKRKSTTNAEDEGAAAPKPEFPRFSLSKGLTTGDVAMRVVQFDRNMHAPDTGLVSLLNDAPDDFGGEELDLEPEVNSDAEGEEGEGEGKGKGGSADAPAAGEAAEAGAEGDKPAGAGDEAAAADGEKKTEGEGTEPAAEGDAAAASKDGEAAAKGEPAKAAEEEDEEDDEEFDEAFEHIFDMSKWISIGGIIMFDLFHLPDEPLGAKKFDLRTLVDNQDDPTRLTYPLPGAPRIPIPDKEGETMDAVAGMAPWESVELDVPLFDGVAIGESAEGPMKPTMGWWDATRKAWRADGFSNVEYNRETNMLKFATSNVAPITILQKRIQHLPLHDWELQPTARGIVSLFLNGNKHTTTLEFNGDGHVRITEPKLPELVTIIDKWHEPHTFVQTMIRKGYNVFPALERITPEGVEQAKFLDMALYVDQGSNQMAAGDAPQRVEKIVGAEQRIYKQMSLLCNAFCFRESYWNQSTAGDDFMVRLVEFEEDGTEKDDARWMTVYCNGVQKAYESAAEEYDAAFSDKPADREIKEYNTLYHAAKATVSPETAEKVFPITAAQSYCITRILKAIRPLHYSTALGAKAFRESERKRVAKEAEEAEKQRIAKEEADAAAAVAAEAEAAAKEKEAKQQKK